MNPVRFFLFSSLILIGLSGCGVRSVSMRGEVAVSADWKNAAGFPVASPSRDLSRWWKRFDDPGLNRIISDAQPTACSQCPCAVQAA